MTIGTRKSRKDEAGLGLVSTPAPGRAIRLVTNDTNVVRAQGTEKGMTTNTPVLIVGAGPVGLALAGDLGWRGISCTLIEKGDGAVDHPKMDLIGVRTMEFCRRW